MNMRVGNENRKTVSVSSILTVQERFEKWCSNPVEKSALGAVLWSESIAGEK
jgi:hypothetical protein